VGVAGGGTDQAVRVCVRASRDDATVTDLEVVDALEEGRPERGVE
jgi:hypothetical protein